MEAALRTAVEPLTGEELQNLGLHRRPAAWKASKGTTYPVAGLEVKVAIASGLGNAKLPEKVKSGEATYHFIEIMGCPGGCINGGRPSNNLATYATASISAACAPKFSTTPTKQPNPQIPRNPAIKGCTQPSSENREVKAHHLLHTTYMEAEVERGSNKI